MENSRRQKIAEIVGKKLFVEQFGWVLRGTANIDWLCTNPPLHGKDKDARMSHPTDACYRYVDPYDATPTYVIIDFKSYGATSITKGNIENYLKKLSSAVKCAPSSSAFQRNFVGQDTDYNVHGILFIYNHDLAYQGDFSAILDEVSTLGADIAKDQSLLIMGPDDVKYFDMICSDMRAERDLFPDLRDVKYFAPDLKTQPVHGKKFGPLSFRMLSSPWQFVAPDGSKPNNQLSDLVVYYRDSGETADEFLWLIDTLIVDLQLLGDNNRIRIRGILPDKEAALRFSEAKESYKEDYHGVTVLSKDEFSARLDRITFESVNSTYSRFSELEVGLE